MKKTYFPVRTLLWLLLPFTLGASFTAQAAADMFLQLDGIRGESVDQWYRGDIDVQAFSEGMSNSHLVTQEGADSGRTQVSAIKVTKYLDRSSPELRRHLAANRTISSARLIVRYAGERPWEVFVIELRDVRVTAISLTAEGGEDRLQETIDLTFRAIQWTYTPMERGAEGTPVSAGYDVANQATTGR
ncbi:Hcp family type VI secretion system effector [Litorivivens sp.]|uniref:Hcp family type VI secretion system effector n=1 Tax=Litorivivens sp. TaxID=2020868 RepID=UPI00356519B8